MLEAQRPSALSADYENRGKIMRVLNGIELATVSGGLATTSFGGDDSHDWGDGGSGGGDGSSAASAGNIPHDNLTYTGSSEPIDFCGNRTFNASEFIAGVYQGQACRAHDVCYAEAQVTRLTCDVQFLTDMQTNCGSNLLCQIGAVGYFVAVRIGGGSSYATPLE